MCDGVRGMFRGLDSVAVVEPGLEDVCPDGSSWNEGSAIRLTPPFFRRGVPFFESAGSGDDDVKSSGGCC